MLLVEIVNISQFWSSTFAQRPSSKFVAVADEDVLHPERRTFLVSAVHAKLTEFEVVARRLPHGTAWHPVVAHARLFFAASDPTDREIHLHNTMASDSALSAFCELFFTFCLRNHLNVHVGPGATTKTKVERQGHGRAAKRAAKRARARIYVEAKLRHKVGLPPKTKVERQGHKRAAKRAAKRATASTYVEPAGHGPGNNSAWIVTHLRGVVVQRDSDVELRRVRLHEEPLPDLQGTAAHKWHGVGAAKKYAVDVPVASCRRPLCRSRAASAPDTSCYGHRCAHRRGVHIPSIAQLKSRRLYMFR